MRVVLARHGETTWNRERRVQGWAPVGLTERGREQAAALGERLADEYDINHIRSSDLPRTRETTAVIRERIDADAQFEPSWRERDFGVYQGFSYETVFGQPELSVEKGGQRAVESAPAEGESLLEVRERVLSGWERLLGRASGDETHLVVTHGGPLALLLGHVKDLDVVDSLVEHAADNCAVSEVRVNGDEATVVRENDRISR